MPMGTPFTVPESLVWFSSLSGLTNESTTRFTEGTPSPRSIIQWFLASKSVMFRTVAQVHASLPQCHVPYTWMGVALAVPIIIIASRIMETGNADFIEAPFREGIVEG